MWGHRASGSLQAAVELQVGVLDASLGQRSGGGMPASETSLIDELPGWGSVGCTLAVDLAPFLWSSVRCTDRQPHAQQLLASSQVAE